MRYVRYSGLDDEPPELCHVGRPGTGIGKEADDATAKFLIIYWIANPFDLKRLMR